jgi:hypothetical protein
MNAEADAMCGSGCDRALLLVGFFAALRRSELAGLTVDQITTHDRGLVLGFARSKTNQTGAERELVVLPALPAPNGARSPRSAPGSNIDHSTSNSATSSA